MTTRLIAFMVYILNFVTDTFRTVIACIQVSLRLDEIYTRSIKDQRLIDYICGNKDNYQLRIKDFPRAGHQP